MRVKDLIRKLQALDEPYSNVMFRNEHHDLEDIEHVRIEPDFYPERGNTIVLSDAD